MSIKNNIAINVLNYNEFIVCSTTQLQGYKFLPAVDKIPSIHSMSFVEIQYINGKSDAFRTGLLRFEKDQEKDVYEALNISDWENIITNDFIEDAIVNSTKEKLQKLIGISNESIFDRVKTIFVRLQNSGEVDISNRVIKALNARTEELRNRIYKSEIVIKSTNKSEDLPSEEVSELRSQLDEMKEMMAQFMLTQGNDSMPEGNDKPASDAENTTEIKKPAGRPANRSK